ncbi:MAG TPA: DUF5317 domain-containing protein [Actinomycetota bacterium]|nr:DUF5317 domain-containing protein [Actinomycetota bacterium]
MLILVVVLVGAAALGVGRGGSLESLAETSFRWSWLIFAGLFLQLGTDLLNPPWLERPGMLAVVFASNALIAIFLVANHRLPGMRIALGGLVLNLAVIAVNGAMPVSPRAAEIARLPPPRRDVELKHEPVSEDTLLAWLGDQIPVPRAKSVLSLGDLVLYLGVARLVYVRTRAAAEKGPNFDA